MVTLIDLAAMIVAIFAALGGTFLIQVLMLRRIRRMVHTVGVMVLQESLKIRRTKG